MKPRVRLSVMAGLLIATMLLAFRVPSASTEEKLVNLNTASAAELAGLKGIGERKAEAIVAHREEHGPFKAVDDLAQVKGIGPKLLEQLRPHVTLGTAAKAPAGAPESAAAKH